MNPYISEQNAGEFTFYRVPKALIDDPQYRGVSTDAKLLYALLLDRLSLSLRSGWQDEQGQTYLYYSVTAIQESLNCCKEKACKLMRELENACLIERKGQGRGKPDRIYPLRFMVAENHLDRSDNQTACNTDQPEKQNAEDRKRSEKQDSGGVKQSENRTASTRPRLEKQSRSGQKNSPPEVGKSDSKKTEKNKTDLSKIHRSSPEPTIEDEIKEQIEYPTLVSRYPADMLDCMVHLMADVERSATQTLRIG